MNREISSDKATNKKLYYVSFLLIIILITAGIPIGLYLYSNPAPPHKKINLSNLLNDEDVNEYLESVLLASKSKSIENNKEFSSLIDYINLAILERYAKKLI